MIDKDYFATTVLFDILGRDEFVEWVTKELSSLGKPILAVVMDGLKQYDKKNLRMRGSND
jgi:hypothetical protein